MSSWTWRPGFLMESPQKKSKLKWDFERKGEKGKVKKFMFGMKTVHCSKLHAFKACLKVLKFQ